MTNYKRITERVGKGISIKETSTNDNKSIWNAIERLAELEDKIENETLIEIDKNLIGEGIIGIHHFTDGTYQLELDENIVIGFTIGGVITWNNTHHYNDEFRSGMFFIDNEKGRAEAERKLEELRAKR
jgi:hypothetical protein